MELVVPQPHVCQPIKSGRRNRPAEGAGCTKAGVIGHDEEDIRSTIWRGHRFWKVGRRLARFATNDASELWLWDWENGRTARWRCRSVGGRGLLSKRLMTSRSKCNGNRAGSEKLRE